MAKVKSIYQGQPVRKKDRTLSGPMYFIVNKSGAVHRVGRDKALDLLKNAKFRLATDEEIERFNDNKIQSHKDPFGTAWDPTPDILINIPEPVVSKEPKIKATAGARELGAEHGVDLTMITATGAGGQIIKKDIQRYLDGDDEPEPEPKAPPPKADPKDPPVDEDEKKEDPPHPGEAKGKPEYKNQAGDVIDPDDEVPGKAPEDPPVDPEE